MSDSPCCDDPRLNYRSAEHVETHGLDCGPYENCHEEWWECASCGETFTGWELDTFNERHAAAEAVNCG